MNCPVCNKPIKDDENYITMSGSLKGPDGNIIDLQNQEIHVFHVTPNNPLARKRREKSALRKLIQDAKRR